MVVVAIVALALRPEGGVVEAEDVAERAGAAGVELVALVRVSVVVHVERLVAAAEPGPALPVQHDHRPHLARPLHAQ